MKKSPLYKSKYHAEKVVVDGIEFHSKGESKRYLYLKELETLGVIEDLERQKKYVLIPAQYEPGVITKSGRFKQGKCLERECAYISDFEYRVEGKHIVEDFKGMRTPEYKIKRKLMLFLKGIRVKEVSKWNESP